VTPIGPTWDFSKYFLGADELGATSSHGCSTAVGSPYHRVFFGLICIVVATVLGCWRATSAGDGLDYLATPRHRVGVPDLPAGISLSVILVTSGLDLGIIHIGAGSLLCRF